MNHLPRRHVVQDHRRCIDIGDTAGDRLEVFGLTYEKFSEATIDCERCHTPAQIETSDTNADRVNHAGDLIARHEGYLGRV
jgi:hypothetical protein